jgi:Fur family transcriptional regulator, peroxide stress response regulator
LAGRGQRFTRQRARVYEVLKATDQHPTAEEVYRKVKQTLPAVSLATVYKSLDALVQCGLALKLTYGDSSARYDGTVGDHPHMRDVQTGQVLDVPMDVAAKLPCVVPGGVSEEIEQRTGFKVAALRVELIGHLQPQAAMPAQ